MLNWNEILTEEQIQQDAVPIQIARKSSKSEQDQLLVYQAFKQLLDGNTCFDTSIEINGHIFNGESSLLGDVDSGKPILKIDKSRAQLDRIFKQETLISNWIKSVSNDMEGIALSDLDKQFLRQLFSNTDETNPQYQAVLEAINNRLVLLTGGPGTGKTYTIVRIVAGLLLHTNLTAEKLVLAAPTGKAASRMAESIRNEITTIKVNDELKKQFPTEGFTLHRLLGITDNPFNARFNKINPLPYDVIIVDEASMIDINLFNALINALSPHSKLIIVGDPNQLPSVEAGRVLADFCEIAEKTTFIKHAKLVESKRFDSKSGIGNLARLVNENKSNEVDQLFDTLQLEFIPASTVNEYQKSIKELVKNQISELSNSSNPKEAFAAFKKTKILTALRSGLLGSEGVNSLLMDNKDHFGSLMKHGVPIMVTKNDYNLNLFNSDIGVYLNSEGKGRIVFESAMGEYRKVNPSLLQNIEAAYAMTVHKSQGSEFEHVILVLPDLSTQQSAAEALITRELIYTAITRAKEKFTLIGSLEQFKRAIGKSLNRKSALVNKVLST